VPLAQAFPYSQPSVSSLYFLTYPWFWFFSLDRFRMFKAPFTDPFTCACSCLTRRHISVHFPLLWFFSLLFSGLSGLRRSLVAVSGWRSLLWGCILQLPLLLSSLFRVTSFSLGLEEGPVRASPPNQVYMLNVPFGV